MPIYEYRCDACGKVSSFLVRSVAEHKGPACPKCGGKGMSRVFSRFATSPRSSRSGSKEAVPAGAPDEGPAGDMGDIPGLEGLDENDPRSLGRSLRKMAEEAGEKLDPEMDEVCRRLESGEDPESIDESLGEGGPGGEGEDDTLYDG